MDDENSNKYCPYLIAISAESSALMLRLLIFRSARLTYFLFYFLPFSICTQHSAEVWVSRLCVFGADCFHRDIHNEVSTCFPGFCWRLIHLITRVIAVDSFVAFSLEEASLKNVLLIICINPSQLSRSPLTVFHLADFNHTFQSTLKTFAIRKKMIYNFLSNTDL